MAGRHPSTCRNGHDVTIVDNLSRRVIDIELEVESLTPIRPIGERLRAWKELRQGDRLRQPGPRPRVRPARQHCLDSAKARRHRPLRRAAGRPVLDALARAKRYTVDNNVRGTHNLLCAIVDSGLDIAVVHLGTMGVYGYGWSGSAPIPEGYLAVKVPTPDGELEREILHPANPGSVYHMTKTLDQLLFAFYAKNDGVRITDLHQGIVWGTQTAQTVDGRPPDQPLRLRRRLRHRAQPVPDAGRHRPPLTVHGTGGQTRAFIHIRDTVRCIEIAINNPPQRGDRRRSSTRSPRPTKVRDLAETGVEAHRRRRSRNLPNPRRRRPRTTSSVERPFLALGLNPTTLSEGCSRRSATSPAYSDRADTTKIIARSTWRPGMETSADLVKG